MSCRGGTPVEATFQGRRSRRKFDRGGGGCGGGGDEEEEEPVLWGSGGGFWTAFFLNSFLIRF